jgi:hypothetical protein
MPGGAWTPREAQALSSAGTLGALPPKPDLSHLFSIPRPAIERPESGFPLGLDILNPGDKVREMRNSPDGFMAFLAEMLPATSEDVLYEILGSTIPPLRFKGARKALSGVSKQLIDALGTKKNREYGYGFVLPDGTATPYVDHHPGMVAHAMGASKDDVVMVDEFPAGDEALEYLSSAMDEGVIRIVPSGREMLNIDIAGPTPTPEQMRTLANIFKEQQPNEIIVDIARSVWDTPVSGRFASFGEFQRFIRDNPLK